MAFESVKRWFRPDPLREAGAALYTDCVRAARRPALYADLGVPDTQEGRLDLLMLHVFLVTRALRGADGAPGRRNLSQAVFDAMTRDLDDTYREEGYGDAKVARLVRTAAEQFYGRGQAYERALAGGDEAALAGALARNAYADEEADAAGLAAYVRRAAGALDADMLREGRAAFPEPTETDTETDHAAA